jgi:probable F420-dependent oxidoreductase
MTITFGLAIRNFVGPGETPDGPGLIRYAERAEALGFESLWAWDHILLGVKPSFPVLDSPTILTAIAARTERIRLGTGVMVLPLRNPVVAAKVLASLDQVSGGRLILGAAAGWYAREFDAVGIPFKDRGRIFERNLDLILRLWTESAVTVQVDGFNLRDAVLLPKPVQRPHPPVLVGGYIDRVLRRAGEKGDGWLTYFYTPAGFAKSWQKVLRFAEEAGRDPATLSATNQLAIYVGPPKEQADGPMRQWLSTEWDIAKWSDSTIEHAIRGTADECVEQLKPHIEAGADRLILIPYRYEQEQVERIAADVIPRLA